MCNNCFFVLIISTHVIILKWCRCVGVLLCCSYCQLAKHDLLLVLGRLQGRLCGCVGVERARGVSMLGGVGDGDRGVGTASWTLGIAVQRGKNVPLGQLCWYDGTSVRPSRFTTTDARECSTICSRGPLQSLESICTAISSVCGRFSWSLWLGRLPVKDADVR